MKDYDKDALLEFIRQNCDQAIITDAAQTTHTLAVSNSLATLSLVPGDFTISAGDVSGKKLTFAGVLETDGLTYAFGGGSANVNHISFYNSTSGERYAITNLAVAKAVNEGDTIEVSPLDILELRDAV